jgi:hypothetical protein
MRGIGNLTGWIIETHGAKNPGLGIYLPWSNQLRENKTWTTYMRNDCLLKLTLRNSTSWESYRLANQYGSQAHTDKFSI